jgi:hypothetical protein
LRHALFHYQYQSPKRGLKWHKGGFALHFSSIQKKANKEKEWLWEYDNINWKKGIVLPLFLF